MFVITLLAISFDFIKRDLFFHSRLLQIQQSGLDIYWSRRNTPLLTAEIICKSSKSLAGDTKLSLRSLLSVFLLLGIGLGLATGAFLLEIGCHFFQSQRICRSSQISNDKNQPQEN